MCRLQDPVDLHLLLVHKSNDSLLLPSLPVPELQQNAVAATKESSRRERRECTARERPQGVRAGTQVLGYGDRRRGLDRR
jgi:hypothetical protein